MSSATAAATKPKTKSKAKGLEKKPISEPEKPRWNMYLKRLVNWATQKGWTVDLAGIDDECDTNQKKISIKKGKRKLETKTYLLLHELGHMILYSKYGDYLDIAREHHFAPNSIVYRIYGVEEEIDAWRCGLDLGESLRIPIDTRQFEIVKARYLATYLLFAVGRKVKSKLERGIKKDTDVLLNTETSVTTGDNPPITVRVSSVTTTTLVSPPSQDLQQNDENQQQPSTTEKKEENSGRTD